MNPSEFFQLHIEPYLALHSERLQVAYPAGFSHAELGQSFELLRARGYGIQAQYWNAEHRLVVVYRRISSGECETCGG